MSLVTFRNPLSSRRHASRAWTLASAIALATAFASGCSSDPATPSTGATSTSTSDASSSSTGVGGSGAGGASGSGGAVMCEAGSHVGPTGACEASLTSWTKGSSLLQKRDHHATFVADSTAGAFLYVLGGIQDNMNELATVEFAPLGADGSVGAWTAGADLPEVMGGHMIATVGSTVMVSGGFRTGPVLSTKTEIATILADGTLGPWKEGPKMKVGRFHHAMVAWKDSFYVVGGLTGDNTDSTPKVERAIVAADGTIGAWAPMTPLPKQRSHHSLAVYEGALYLTAGLTGDPAGVHTDLKDVLRAPILDDGTVGAWTTVGMLPATLGTHASFAHLGYLYVLGGVENNAADTAHVRRAAIGKDGMLGAWEDLAPLPKARAHDHHTPYHAGFVYAAGGAVNHISVNDVFVGHLE